MIETGMSPREWELAREAVDAIARVFEQHEGGVFDVGALRKLDHHAYTVRISTADAVCREKLGDIQDRAAVYFSSRCGDRGRREGTPSVESLSLEIEQAVGALRARLQELGSAASA